MITAGVQNMGLTALAMGELDADALTQSFLTGAGGEASSLAVDKIIGDENLQTIADATGLSKDQAGSIATSALMNGINSEVTGTNNFFDSVFQTLVVSGVSTVTANKVAAALDDTTSDKGRAAIVGATKNIMDVAGTAAWNDMDVGDALEAMAPGIIGSALSTYVRTPETTKTDDKAKVVEVDGVKVAGPADQEALAATRINHLLARLHHRLSPTIAAQPVEQSLARTTKANPTVTPSLQILTGMSHTVTKQRPEIWSRVQPDRI
jgi:hypothetical protein